MTWIKFTITRTIVDWYSVRDSERAEENLAAINKSLSKMHSANDYMSPVEFECNMKIN